MNYDSDLSLQDLKGMYMSILTSHTPIHINVSTSMLGFNINTILGCQFCKLFHMSIYLSQDIYHILQIIL